MGASALLSKSRSTSARTQDMDYPISVEARQRIDSARVSAIIFQMKRVLSEGGFRQHEVESIVSVIAPSLQQGKIPTYEQVFQGLRGRQFSKSLADEIARKLVSPM